MHVPTLPLVPPGESSGRFATESRIPDSSCRIRRGRYGTVYGPLSGMQHPTSTSFRTGNLRPPSCVSGIPQTLVQYCSARSLWRELASRPLPIYTSAMANLLRISIGSLCIVIGLAGLALPILQGWLFLGLGFVLLAPSIPFFGRILCRLENRYPTLSKPLHKIRKFSDRSGKPVQPCPPDKEQGK